MIAEIFFENLNFEIIEKKQVENVIICQEMLYYSTWKVVKEISLNTLSAKMTEHYEQIWCLWLWAALQQEYHHIHF